MEKELKKLYCENCNKEFIEKDDVYFCPICASVLIDTGEKVFIEEPKKKQKNKKQLNKSIGNFDKKHKVKNPLPKLEFGEYMKIMGWFGAVLTTLIMIIFLLKDCKDAGEAIAGGILILVFGGFIVIALIFFVGFVPGWIIGLVLYPITYPLVCFFKSKR